MSGGAGSSNRMVVKALDDLSGIYLCYILLFII